MASTVYRDADGIKLNDGDRVYFSYGIPPVRAYGTFTGGDVVVDAPHTPSRTTFKHLKKCVQLIYKDGAATHQYRG
jgi:hypothetical protein